MFMTWFVVSSRTEFEIKSNHFGGRENNLWQKLANFFPLLGIHLALATGFHGSPIVWRKRKRSRWRLAIKGVEGWWIPPTLPSPVFVHLWYEGLRIWGRVVSSTQGCRRSFHRYTRQGEGARSGTNARARATTRRTHARTHERTQRLFTPIKGYQERIGTRRKQESSKNTKHGEMKSIKRAENCIGTRTSYVVH